MFGGPPFLLVGCFCLNALWFCWEPLFGLSATILPLFPCVTAFSAFCQRHLTGTQLAMMCVIWFHCTAVSVMKPSTHGANMYKSAAGCCCTGLPELAYLVAGFILVVALGFTLYHSVFCWQLTTALSLTESDGRCCLTSQCRI